MTLSVIQKSHFEKSDKEKNRKIKFILIISEELLSKKKIVQINNFPLNHMDGIILREYYLSMTYKYLTGNNKKEI